MQNQEGVLLKYFLHLVCSSSTFNDQNDAHLVKTFLPIRLFLKTGDQTACTASNL